MAKKCTKKIFYTGLIAVQNFFKVFFSKEKKGNKRVIHIGGIRLSYTKKNNIERMVEQLCRKEINAIISSFLNCFCDITSIKIKDGKLSYLNNGNTELIRIVDEICRKYNLRYWLEYGTLLGAMRHQGPVPWDYDADIAMPRSDFDKLRDVIELELKDTNIEVYGVSKILPGVGAVIVLKNKGIEFLNLDIIPFEFFPERLNETKKDILTQKLIQGKKYYLSLLPASKGMSSPEQISDLYNKINNYTSDIIRGGVTEVDEKKLPSIFKGICLTKDKYYKNIYDYEIVFPLKRTKFAGYEFNIPNNAAYILTKVYGDWQSFPQEFELKTLFYLSQNIPSNAKEIVDDLKKVKVIKND